MSDPEDVLYERTAQPLHPESKQLVKTMKDMNLKRYDEIDDITAARQRSRLASKAYSGEVEYNGVREEIHIPSNEIEEGIPVYVYKPAGVTEHNNPAIFIYCHGGGNVVGCRDNVDTLCKILSQGAACIVVNVEYRLAPEFKFPCGLNDACDVTKWVLSNKTKIGGGEGSKVGVGGDSAGGQIASGVAHDVPGLAFQVLVYAHVSARGDRSLPSFQEYKYGPILHKGLVDWFENHMGDVKDWRNPRFANLLREKFDYLSPCLLIVAECDPLRDDSYEYSKKLTEAGVYHEIHLSKGAIHGFYSLPAAFPTLAGAAHQITIEFIKKFGQA